MKTDKYHKHSKSYLEKKVNLTLHGDHERLLSEDNTELDF